MPREFVSPCAKWKKRRERWEGVLLTGRGTQVCNLSRKIISRAFRGRGFARDEDGEGRKTTSARDEGERSCYSGYAIKT